MLRRVAVGSGDGVVDGAQSVMDGHAGAVIDKGAIEQQLAV